MAPPPAAASTTAMAVVREQGHSCWLPLAQQLRRLLFWASLNHSLTNNLQQVSHGHVDVGGDAASDGVAVARQPACQLACDCDGCTRTAAEQQTVRSGLQTPPSCNCASRAVISTHLARSRRERTSAPAAAHQTGGTCVCVQAAGRKGAADAELSCQARHTHTHWLLHRVCRTQRCCTSLAARTHLSARDSLLLMMLNSAPRPAAKSAKPRAKAAYRTRCCLNTSCGTCCVMAKMILEV